MKSTRASILLRPRESYETLPMNGAGRIRVILLPPEKTRNVLITGKLNSLIYDTYHFAPKMIGVPIRKESEQGYTLGDLINISSSEDKQNRCKKQLNHHGN